MNLQTLERMKTLQNLNRTTPRRHEVVASADDATVYLYDFVGSDGWGGGVDAKTFVRELNALKASTIHLRINSPGGDVFAGRAMATALRSHGAKVIAYVDGLAASAASFIALAADEVEMAPGSMMMIHRASGLVWGTADDMLEMAELLEKIDGTLVDEYVRETENEAEQVKAWMDAETWFTADEAVLNGFADRVGATVKADNRWDVSAYANAPPLAVIRAEAFKVGDRVRVKEGMGHDEETMDGVGEIVEISTSALGIQFDDMEDVHKWYVAEELEAESVEASQDKKQKKHKMEQNHAERERRFRVVERTA